MYINLKRIGRTSVLLVLTSVLFVYSLGRQVENGGNPSNDFPAQNNSNEISNNGSVKEAVHFEHEIDSYVPKKNSNDD